MQPKLVILETLVLLATLSFLFYTNIHFFCFSYNRAMLVSDTNKLAGTGKEPSAAPEFSILIGILTRADFYDRRNFLRLIYDTQSTPLAEIHVKFVFCKLTNEEQRVVVALEILRYGDIIILKCTENMNSGKTYTYFSTLPTILPRRYDYIMKSDDDAFVRFASLAASLMPLPRRDLYYGAIYPCESKNPFAGYMTGMGFILSWDNVKWIAESKIPKNETIGPEDRMVMKWLAAGGKGTNRFSARPAMYDYPGSSRKPCSGDELLPETVIVHKLKKLDRWLHVVKFFNLTRGLKPSKLYHID